MARNTLTNQLFEASYSPWFTHVSKDELRSSLEDRLAELTDGIDRKLPAKELLENLSKEIRDYTKYYAKPSEAYVFFAVDFVLEKRINCIVYADLIVSGLEFLGREDVLKRMSVKYGRNQSEFDHIWLVCHDGFISLEILKGGYESDKKYPLRSLIATNWQDKGNFFYKAEAYDEALEYYNESLKLGLNFAGVWQNKANCFSSLNKHKEAIKCCKRAIKLEPTAITWSNMGAIFHELKKYRKAIECYDKALKIEPDNAFILENKKNAIKWNDKKDISENLFFRRKIINYQQYLNNK